MRNSVSQFTIGVYYKNYIEFIIENSYRVAYINYQASELNRRMARKNFCRKKPAGAPRAPPSRFSIVCEHTPPLLNNNSDRSSARVGVVLHI